MNSMSVLEARVAELERKVDILTKALNILLAEGEELPEEEVKEIKARLEDWLKKRSEKFTDLEEVLNEI